MTSSKERILQMLASGKINSDEANKLLDAITERRVSKFKIFFDPFDKLTVGLGIALSILFATLSILLSKFNIRYDGALDLHIVDRKVLFLEAFFDQFVAWPCTALVFWIITIKYAKGGRFIDFLMGVGVARFPMLLGGFMGAMISLLFSGIISKRSVLLLSVAFVIPCCVWFITLLFFSFKTASGLSGLRLTVLFIVSLVVAELLSINLLEYFVVNFAT